MHSSFPLFSYMWKAWVSIPTPPSLPSLSLLGCFLPRAVSTGITEQFLCAAPLRNTYSWIQCAHKGQPSKADNCQCLLNPCYIHNTPLLHVASFKAPFGIQVSGFIVRQAGQLGVTRQNVSWARLMDLMDSMRQEKALKLSFQHVHTVLYKYAACHWVNKTTNLVQYKWSKNAAELQPGQPCYR